MESRWKITQAYPSRLSERDSCVCSELQSTPPDKEDVDCMIKQFAVRSRYSSVVFNSFHATYIIEGWIRLVHLISLQFALL